MSRTMKLRISAGKLLKGNIVVPSSKSYLHRAMLCAALADAPTVIACHGYGDDINETAEALRRMGAQVVTAEDSITVTPIKEFCPTKFHVEASGTTLRFLLILAVTTNQSYTISLGESLRKRGIEDMIQHLRACGAEVSYHDGIITVLPSVVHTFRFPGKISSQFFSGALLALPRIGGNVECDGTVVSAGYIELTEQIVSSFGVGAMFGENIVIQPYYSPGKLIAPADASSCSFWWGANALGGEVCVIDETESVRQPDCAIKDILKQSNSVIDITNIPDGLPIMAVVAAAKGEATRFIGTERLRIKESDRVKSVCEMIENLGGRVAVSHDCVEIRPQKLTGGTVNSYGDHRIAMATAIASCVCREDIVLIGAEAVTKSYPAFFEHFTMLGGEIGEI